MATGRRAPLAAKLVLAGVSVVLMLVTGEIVLRVLERGDRAGTVKDVVDRGEFVMHLPGAVIRHETETGDTVTWTTDALGLRNPPGRTREDTGYAGTGSRARRVLVLGDSYVEGANTVEGRLFTDVLENRLRASADDWTVINAGMAGYGTAQSTLLLAEIWPRTDPGIVLLMVCLSNDLQDNYFFTPAARGKLAALGRTAAPAGAIAREKVAGASPGMRPALAARLRDFAGQSRLAGLAFRAAQRDQWRDYFVFELESYRKRAKPPVMAAAGNTGFILEQLGSFVAARDAALIVCGIPAKAQVYEEFSFISKVEVSPGSTDRMLELMRDPGGYSFELPTRYFREACARAEVQYLDLTPLFREKRAGKLYGQMDRHWNDHGQAIAADAVAVFLSGM